MFVFHKLFAFRLHQVLLDCDPELPQVAWPTHFLRVVIFPTPQKRGENHAKKKIREISNQDSPTFQELITLRESTFCALTIHVASSKSRVQDPTRPNVAEVALIREYVPCPKELGEAFSTPENAFIACPCKKSMGEDDPVLRVWVSVSFQGAKCSGKTLDFLSDILHEFDR